MIEIVKPTITKEIDENGHYGKFVVEPLERGYGTTLGNCMRRILLSSLPGAAITSVKIDGILHEFSTIPGVKEDVTEIILNLKRLAVRINGDENKRAIINAVGPKEVTAADIIVDADTEIFNPDLHIATLADNATLVMEMNLTSGRGYVPAEQNKKEKAKKQLLLRLSPTLWQELASWAEDDFRSINGQIEYLLTECVKKRKKSFAPPAEENEQA